MSNSLFKSTQHPKSQDCSLHPNFKNDYTIWSSDEEEKYGSEIIEHSNDGFINIDSLVTKRFSTDGYIKRRPWSENRHTIYKKFDFWSGILTHDNPLSDFNEVIEKSKVILNLQDGWDEGDAKPINPFLFNTSCKCISDYIEAIYSDKYFIIKSPQINPVPNGSIDFEWQLPTARMLINFRIEDDVINAYYYGDLRNNEIPIKGSVRTNQIYEHLMKWMQFLK